MYHLLKSRWTMGNWGLWDTMGSQLDCMQVSWIVDLVGSRVLACMLNCLGIQRPFIFLGRPISSTLCPLRAFSRSPLSSERESGPTGPSDFQEHSGAQEGVHMRIQQASGLAHVLAIQRSFGKQTSIVTSSILFSNTCQLQMAL